MSQLVEHCSLWSGLTSQPGDDAEIGVLGVPFDNAVSWRGGTRHAPQRIRSITPHLANITEEGLPLKVRVLTTAVTVSRASILMRLMTGTPRAVRSNSGI